MCDVAEELKVFVSYRREDASGYAGRIYDSLSQHFGRESIFYDIDSISVGRDFEAVLEETLNHATVMLVVMGPRWGDRRHLKDPKDWPRLEVERALARGGEVLVIPVLVGGAKMPNPQDVPPSLREFTRHEATSLIDEHWPATMEALVRALERIPKDRAGTASPPMPAQSGSGPPRPEPSATPSPRTAAQSGSGPPQAKPSATVASAADPVSYSDQDLTKWLAARNPVQRPPDLEGAFRVFRRPGAVLAYAPSNAGLVTIVTTLTLYRSYVFVYFDGLRVGEVTKEQTWFQFVWAKEEPWFQFVCQPGRHRIGVWTESTTAGNPYGEMPSLTVDLAAKEEMMLYCSAPGFFRRGLPVISRDRFTWGARLAPWWHRTADPEPDVGDGE
jgi:hypothetical protein